MARIQTIMYQCDWCKTRVPPIEVYGHDAPPDDWKEVEGETLLCKPCVEARSEAIEDARARRIKSFLPEGDEAQRDYDVGGFDPGTAE